VSKTGVTVDVGVFVAPLPPDPVGSRLQVALQLESEMQHWVCLSSGISYRSRNSRRKEDFGRGICVESDSVTMPMQ